MNTSDFSCPVVEIDIEEHPNADRLEIARVRGTDLSGIVVKGQFTNGDRVIYIPEAAIVPDEVLETVGLVGKLAGAKKNRVKPMRLRGIFSEGIFLPCSEECALGDDMTEALGIVKYLPKRKGMCFSGKVRPQPHEGAFNFSNRIVHLNRAPDLIAEGTMVEVTEKLHGTFICIGLVSEENAHESFGRRIAFSKGIGAYGNAFDPTDMTNVYVKAAHDYGVWEKLEELDGAEYDMFLCGELFGQGVQGGMGYGVAPEIRFFDAALTSFSGSLEYLPALNARELIKDLGLNYVPVLGEVPYSYELIKSMAQGKETVSGESLHIREGVVVRALTHTSREKFGSAYKYVSEAYKTRKNGTEYT